MLIMKRGRRVVFGIDCERTLKRWENEEMTIKDSLVKIFVCLAIVVTVVLKQLQVIGELTGSFILTALLFLTTYLILIKKYYFLSSTWSKDSQNLESVGKWTGLFAGFIGIVYLILTIIALF